MANVTTPDQPPAAEPAKPAEKPRMTNAQLATYQLVKDPELLKEYDRMVTALNIVPKPVFVEHIQSIFPQAAAGTTQEGQSFIAVLSPYERPQDRQGVLGVIAHELGHIQNGDTVGPKPDDLTQRQRETRADDVAVSLCLGRPYVEHLAVNYNLAVLAAREANKPLAEYTLANAGDHPPIDARLQRLVTQTLALEASGTCPSPDGPSPTPNCKPGAGQNCGR